MNDNISFEPTRVHYQIKAAFWSKAERLGYTVDSNITLATAIEVTEDTRLQSFWSIPGFADWFSDGGTFESQILELLYQFPAHALNILNDDNATAAAKVNLLKLLAEVGRKMPSKQKEIVYADKQIQKMDRKQLEDYVRKHSKLIGGGDG